LLQNCTGDLVAAGAFTVEVDRRDNETYLVHKDFSLALKCRHIIEESPIASDQRFRSKILRNLLARSSGYPEERKMVSGAVLRFGGKAVSGAALHEQVEWHWKGGKNNER
jgi:hypothetical protein